MWVLINWCCLKRGSSRGGLYEHHFAVIPSHFDTNSHFSIKMSQHHPLKRSARKDQLVPFPLFLKFTTLLFNQSPVSRMTEQKRMGRWYFGGLASAGAACCTHPLDLIKVGSFYLSILNWFATILITVEGFLYSFAILLHLTAWSHRV